VRRNPKVGKQIRVADRVNSRVGGRFVIVGIIGVIFGELKLQRR